MHFFYKKILVCKNFLCIKNYCNCSDHLLQNPTFGAFLLLMLLLRQPINDSYDCRNRDFRNYVLRRGRVRGDYTAH